MYATNSAIAGLDKATAQKILKVWEQTGAGSSPDALRKMLINRSLRTLGTVLLQVALDTGVCWSMYIMLVLDWQGPSATVDFTGQRKGCTLLSGRLYRAGASWGAFSTAGYIANGGDFFGKIAVEYLAYALGLYFAIGTPYQALSTVKN